MSSVLAGSKDSRAQICRPYESTIQRIWLLSCHCNEIGESEIGNTKDPVFYLHVFVINIDAILLDEDGIQILENRSEPQKRSTCRARMPFGL